MPEIARRLGISDQAVRKWWHGQGEPSTQRVRELASLLGVSPGWLQYGELASSASPSAGESPNKSHSEPAEDVSMVNERLLAADAPRSRVPVIAWSAIDRFRAKSATQGPSVGEQAANDYHTIACPVLHGPNTFALRWHGSSMAPEYRDGDLLYIDPDAPIGHNADVIARLPSGEHVFRRLERTTQGDHLIQLNAAIVSTPIPVSPTVEIVGRVILSAQIR